MPNVSIADIVTLDDEVVTTTKVETVDDVLNFNEDIFPHINFVGTDDFIYLGDAFTSSNPGSTFNRPLNDLLVFGDVFAAGQNIESIDEFLFIYDWLELPNATTLFETVVFSETMSGLSGPSLSDTVVLDDVFTVLLSSVLATEDDLDLMDAFGIYFNDPWTPSGPTPEEAPCV